MPARNSQGKTIWKRALLLTLAALVVTAAAFMPTFASGAGDAGAGDDGAHDHAAHSGVGYELAQVRRATARFHRVEEAVAAGYELGWVNGSKNRIITGCVSHATDGAMGYHYFHPDLMADLTVDPVEPEALVYAPGSHGKLQLAAVEWIVRGANSNPPGVSEAPTVLGMQMHILVPPVGFYLKHAWVWTNNPSGMFADWNPEVSCS